MRRPTGEALLANQSRLADGFPLAEEALRVATKHGLIALARYIEPVVNRIRGLLE